MRAYLSLFRIAICVLALCALAQGKEPPGVKKNLAEAFVSPPDSSRLAVWWMWQGNNVTPETITTDLEALKAQGIGTALVYSFTGPGNKGPQFMSEQWRALWKHALSEADRLGMRLSVMACSGWNAGGPWITPELACKRHVLSQVIVEGPRKFHEKLPVSANADARYYRDVAVQAFPLAAEPNTDIARRVQKQLDAKTMEVTVNGNQPTAAIQEQFRKPLPAEAAEMIIDPARIIDLTARMDADGMLEWDVPAGRWAILRSGYSLTGAKVHWPTPGGEGLEADPLDGAAMEAQFANVVAPLAEDAGALLGKVFSSTMIDSWEMGKINPNWTAEFPQVFKKLRGYDPLPYLPVFAGHVVGSAQITDRFLHDYRKTLGDLVADNYYGRLTTLAEARGLANHSEAGAMTPKVMAMDCLKNLGRGTYPMGEFWQANTWMEANQNKNGKETASAAHIYGKNLAAAEAFTGGIFESPSGLKPTADRAFCEGFNQFFVHVSPATQPEDGMPGGLFVGTHFNRKITWWNQARPFADYIARCQQMLRQGLFVADVLFYNGDGCPNYVESKRVNPSLGAGYDYDVCNSEVILNRLSVKDGRIVLPDGMSYRMLVLPDGADLPLEILTKLKQLVAAGMTLVGPKPAFDPSLADYPRRDRALQDLASEIWGACDGNQVQENTVGRGRVIWGRPLRKILLENGVPPDLTVTSDREDAFVDWIHRRVGDVDLYFLANRKDHAEQALCTFRVNGRQPELWDPARGTMRDLPVFEQKEGLVSVPLEFDPYGSYFIVFRKPAGPAQDGKNFPTLQPVREIAGPWQVQFDPQWFYPDNGTGGNLTFDKLEDWAVRPEEAIRHFSGTATYRAAFEASAEEAKSPLLLDLGVVNHVARVRLNGRDLGVAWTAPWRVNLTGAIKAGTNVLEIEVTNLWTNRLIGDGQLPTDKKRTVTTWTQYSKPDPKTKKPFEPISSGLLGPVTLQVAK